MRLHDFVNGLNLGATIGMLSDFERVKKRQKHRRNVGCVLCGMNVHVHLMKMHRLIIYQPRGQNRINLVTLSMTMERGSQSTSNFYDVCRMKRYALFAPFVIFLLFSFLRLLFIALFTVNIIALLWSV